MNNKTQLLNIEKKSASNVRRDLEFKMYEESKIHLLLRLGVIVVLILSILLGLQTLKLPVPLSVSAPTNIFSAQRAMTYVSRIAIKAHAIGTQENVLVRNYLISELKKLNIEAEIQTELAIDQNNNIAGYVNNIVARIPSKKQGKAILLAAHYDSVPTGFGAADNGASVGSILETLRVLSVTERLQNDIVILFSDGEEAGLLGARAFINSHRWAKDIAVALNFEYRGNSGPMLMFETTDNNGMLIDGFAKQLHPVGNSIMYELYRMLQNDTDMTIFKKINLAGMNFAAIGQVNSYHSQLDRADTLDQGTLQHQGDLMLGLVQYFGNSNLVELKSANQVYFDIPFFGLVYYSITVAFFFASVPCILFGCVIYSGKKNCSIQIKRILYAAFLFLLTSIGIAIICALVWIVIGHFHPHYKQLTDVYNYKWYWIGFISMSLSLFMILQTQLERRFLLMELALGGSFIWLLLLIISCLMAPGASFLFTWPFIPVLFTLLLLLSKCRKKIHQHLRMLLLLGAVLPAVILYAPLIVLLFTSFSTNALAIPILLLNVMFLLFIPLLTEFRKGKFWYFIPLSCALGFFIIGSFTGRISENQPRHNNLSYLYDGETGNSLWLSTDKKLDTWQLKMFGEKATYLKLPEIFGVYAKQNWVARAPAINISAPEIQILSDVVIGDTRKLKLHLKSTRHAPEVKLYVEGVPVNNAMLQEIRLIKESRTTWNLTIVALPKDGVNIQFEVPNGKAFMIRVFDISYGMSDMVPARDNNVIAQPNTLSDSVRAYRSMSFK